MKRRTRVILTTKVFFKPQKSGSSANLFCAFCGLHKKWNRAPKARNMTARGKCRAKRGTSPLVSDRRSDPALKARNTSYILAFQASSARVHRNQGRRALPCSALAPGCHIPRLRRSVFTFYAERVLWLIVVESLRQVAHTAAL